MPWHFASDELKAKTKEAVKLAQEKGKSIEEVSLGFSLHPTDQRIATSLVSVPDRQKLIQNLDIAAKPRTEEDDKLYAEFREVFGNTNNHWEGREREAYLNSLEESQ